MSNLPSRARGRKQIRVFLSYAYADLVGARKIRKLLVHGLGFKVFLREDLIADSNFLPKLRDELEQADIFVALLTPYSVTESELLQETGAAWGLEKPTFPIVTRRDVLNNFPIALDPEAMIEINYLDRIEEPANAEKFIRAFENTLSASRLSVGKA